MESTFCSFTEAGQQRQSREGLQFQWLKSELPMGECLKWKIPNIPVLTWLTSPGGTISMCDLSPVPSAEQLLPWHQSLGFTQPEEQQLQSSSKSRCQWESMRRQHKPCDPPGSSVTLKCSEGSWEGPGQCQIPKGFGTAALAFETPSPVPSPLGAVPSPPPSTGEMWHCPPPVPFCGHLSCTPVKRCLKFQSLPTLRAWGCWDAPPGHPSLERAGTMPGSFWGFLNLGCLTLFWKSLQVN